MKTVMGVLVGMFLMGLVPAVSALTVDLSSPQEGVTLAPGDALELALSVANDTEDLELAVAVLDVQVDKVPGDGVPEPAPSNIPGISHKPIRIKLGPGESVEKIFELILPAYKQLPAGEYSFTINVAAKGLISGSEAADSITLVMVKE